MISNGCVNFVRALGASSSANQKKNAVSHTLKLSSRAGIFCYLKSYSIMRTGVLFFSATLGGAQHICANALSVHVLWDLE